MRRGDSAVAAFLIAAILAVGVYFAAFHSPMTKQAGAPANIVAPTPMWAAAAPGRVEPKGGEVSVSSLVGGRIERVVVKLKSSVKAGDTIVMLAADEHLARISSAVAGVAAARRDRDRETVTGLANDRRIAEDKLYDAERKLFRNRQELERTLQDKAGAPSSSWEIEASRTSVRTAEEEVESLRDQLRTLEAKSGMPLHTRGEAGLVSARAQLALAEIAYLHTRIRAPIDGTILQLPAKVGEMVAPSPANPLFLIGDIDTLRVRAEVPEADMSQVTVGQEAVIKTDAHPDKEFTARVVEIAQTLGASKLALRGPRKPTDFDTLEVVLDVDGRTPLLPGQRVDVFFRKSVAENKRPDPDKTALKQQ